jgi:phosphoribosyl-ATP pyrophosphohydrolase/phosphoribosyl-AMP cyclohydrolase
MEIRFDANGLVPAIVIDAATGEVLTLAYMNQEALRRSEESNETWFWSRSRSSLWHKGETSGHTQTIVSIAPDCDQDALVVRVIPRGPACHTGARSCFSGPAGGSVVLLDQTIQSRARELPPQSYTTRLLQDENLRIKKLGEETAELILALLAGTEKQVAEEASDLLFHVGAALAARGVSLAEVARVLLERAGPLVPAQVPPEIEEKRH